MVQQLSSEVELDERLARVRERMSERGLDALFVTDPANIYYLSDYNAWSFYTPQTLFVPLEGEPVLAMREMDARGAHRTATRYGDTVLAYPETLVHRPDTHPFGWIAQRIRDLGHLGGSQPRVGVEGESHFFSVRAYLALTGEMGHCVFEDSGELVNWVRLIKSNHEIALMRRAGVVASHAMRAAYSSLIPGTPLNEIAATVQQAQAQGTDGVDGDYPAIVPMFPRGEGADTPHLTWTADKIMPGEAVSIELAGVFRRYHVPLARTVSLGTPTRELDRLAKITVEGLTAALEELVPGSTPAAAAAAWDRVLDHYGLEKRSRLGYSVGIGYPPDWGERTVSIRSDDTTELQENMTFHVIAGMWMTGYGFEASETVRVAPGGPELFTDVDRALLKQEAL